MSTKIYNGYRLASGTDVFAFCNAVRAVMNPIRDTLDATSMINEAVFIHDLRFLITTDKEVESPQAPLAAAVRKHMEGQRELKSGSFDFDENHFNMSLGYDPVTDRILVLLFAELPKYKEAFEGLAAVEEYGYWDNTDPLEDVSEEAWEERKCAWERVMPGTSPPIESMLSFDLRGATSSSQLNILHNVDDKGSALTAVPLPTVEDRVENLAHQLIWEKLERELTEDNFMDYLHEIPKHPRHPELIDVYKQVLAGVKPLTTEVLLTAEDAVNAETYAHMTHAATIASDIASDVITELQEV